MANFSSAGAICWMRRIASELGSILTRVVRKLESRPSHQHFTDPRRNRAGHCTIRRWGPVEEQGSDQNLRSREAPRQRDGQQRLLLDNGPTGSYCCYKRPYTSAQAPSPAPCPRLATPGPEALRTYCCFCVLTSLERCTTFPVFMLVRWHSHAF